MPPRWGLSSRGSLGAELAFVHVVDPVLLAGTESAIPGEELAALLEQDAKVLLDKLSSQAAGKPSPLQFLRRGAPASEILSVAREWRADLIVVGTHGQGGVARLLVGSVAEAVLRHASCPVLVARLHA